MKTVTYQNKTFTLFLEEAKIQAKIAEIAQKINQDYAGKSPLVVPILNGSFLFAADLVRHLTVDPEIHFVSISSYGDALSSSGKVNIFHDLQVEIQGRDIILVEDIVDTGLTCQHYMEHLRKSNPSSVKLTTLLFKPETFKGNYQPDYIGFEIPPEFVIGYGMDIEQQARELRDIYHLK